MSNLKFLIFSMLVLLSVSTSEAQENGSPVIRNYHPNEYNNSTQIFGAVQDARGLFYFGVDGGVMEYDGVSWRFISNHRNAYTYDLERSNDGKIYVGANSEFGFLDTDNKGNTVYKSLTEMVRDSTIKLGPVWSVKSTSKFVYFRTYSAIIQFSSSPERLKVFKADPNSSFSVDFVDKDIYYASMSEKGLMKIEGDEMSKVPGTELFSGLNSLTILPYNATTLFVPTRIEGCYLFQPGTGISPKVFKILDSDFITDNNIYCASALQHEKYMLGSLKKGALLIDKDGNVLQQYNERNLLQDNEILKITTDTSQNLWFGLNNGISKTEQSQDFSFWNKDTGLHGIVEQVIRHEHTIYIATSNKVYFINKKHQVQEVQGIQTGQCWSFLETKLNNSLLTGVSDGIYEIKKDKAEKICFGAQVVKMVQSVKNPERIFAINGRKLISLKYGQGKWLLEGDWSGIDDEILDLVEDENGEIWLGTSNNGVIRVTPNKVMITKPTKVRYYKNNAHDNSPVKFRNKIVFGSKSGLTYYNSKSDSIEPYHEFGAQFCQGGQDVSSFIEMPDGIIWVCPGDNKSSDIGYLKPNNKGSYDWVFAPFRRLPKMSIESSYIEPSGITWICGSEGLFRYDGSKDTKDYNLNFKCLIRRITCGPDSLLYGGNDLNLKEVKQLAPIKYKYNNLNFEFAAPFFDKEEKTLYSFQLEGYDKNWSKWGRDTQNDYSKIHEGDYTFRVKARNIYNVESEIDSCQITILPPWYRTIWAYFAYLLLLIVTIRIFFKLYSRRLQLANIQLERIVNERTLEITRQKEEIQKKNEELSRSNSEKDKFFSIIAHDLRGPFNGFLGLTQVMAEDLASFTQQELQEMTIMLENSASNLFQLLENLLNWSMMQQGLIKFNPANLQLLAAVEESNSILLEQARIKGIEITVDISSELTVFAESNILQSIIRNLVSNALKFTHHGGKVSISASAVENKVIVAIRDTGIGMSKAMVDNLFLLHVKTGRFGTEGEPSSGLGLVLCKEFIEKQGGDIWVESEVDKGTTFYFSIPTI